MRLGLWVVLAGCGTSAPPASTTSSGTTPTPGLTTATTPDEVVDTFVQQIAGPADVLLVVQPELAGEALESLPHFLDAFLPHGDLRIGLLSTAVGDPEQAGALTGWVTLGDHDLLAGLAADLDDTGPYSVLESTWLAVEDSASVNAGFRRPGADLHIVAVVSSDDGTEALTASNWSLWFQSLERSGSVSMLVPGGGLPELEELGDELGSVSTDESVDYAMEGAALEVAGYRQSFFLSRDPDLATLELEVHEADVTFVFRIDDDFVYEPATNAVRFLEYIPSPGAEISATYLAVR